MSHDTWDRLILSALVLCMVAVIILAFFGLFLDYKGW